MPHRAQPSPAARIMTYFGTVAIILLFPVALLLKLLLALLMVVAEIAVDVWDDWKNVLDEFYRCRTPLEERKGRSGEFIQGWSNVAAGNLSREPQNQRLRAEAPAIIRDAVARGLVVKASYGYGQRETRYIEWISDDDERVIAHRYQEGKGECDRDTFQLSSFCYQREECTPEEIFVPVERSRPTASGENKDK